MTATKKKVAKKPKKKIASKPKRNAAARPKGTAAKPQRIFYHERLGITKEQAYILGIAAALIVAISLFFAFNSEVATPAPAAIEAIATPQPRQETVLTVVSDPSCAFCNKFIKPVEDQVMKAAFSGITIREISANSDEGNSLIASLGIKALPAYIFDSQITTEENYSTFKPFLHEAGGNYYLDEKTIKDVAIRYFSLPSTDGEPSMGSENATVTIIEFADPACKACKVFNLNTIPMIENTYNGTVRIVFKTLPLSPATLNASIAMKCAGEQGKFWEYAHAGYEEGVGNLTALAMGTGLNMTRFESCLSTQKYKDDVMNNRDEVISYYGVTGIPTIFINGIKITGVPTDEAMKKIINAELA